MYAYSWRNGQAVFGKARQHMGVDRAAYSNNCKYLYKSDFRVAGRQYMVGWTRKSWGCISPFVCPTFLTVVMGVCGHFCVSLPGRSVVTACVGRPSRAFGRCLLVPKCSSYRYVPTGISLGAPLIGFGGKRRPTVRLTVPVISTVVRTISNRELTMRLTHGNNISFVCNSRAPRSRTTVITHIGTGGTKFMFDSSGLTPIGALTSVLTLGRGAKRSAITVARSNAPGKGLIKVMSDHSCHIDHVSHDRGVTSFVAPLRGLIATKFNVALSRTGSVV